MSSRLVAGLPARPSVAVATPFATAKPLTVPTATDAAARHLAELEQRKRSVSATLRRIRCEQELSLVEQRRDREMRRLHDRIDRIAADRINKASTPSRRANTHHE